MVHRWYEQKKVTQNKNPKQEYCKCGWHARGVNLTLKK